MNADAIHITPNGSISLLIGGEWTDCDLASDWFLDGWRCIAERAAAAHGYRLSGPWADHEEAGGYFGVRAAIEPVATP
jgi:hypothetical protein